MAKAATYIKNIRAQIKYNHGGKVPDFLNLTIQRYAKALELWDYYQEKMQKDGPFIWENNTGGFPVRKQHPLCNLIYQQEAICQKFAKDLGLTAAKAAAKQDTPSGQNATDSLNEFIDGIKG